MGKTMRNLAYRPKREEYAPTKDIVISWLFADGN